jgi:TatD DNase family protein
MEIKQLAEMIDKHRDRIVAVWECGTDLYWTSWLDSLGITSLAALQGELFFKQCLLARHHRLPVVVHSRSDWYGTRAVVQQFPDLVFYFHCRSYWPGEIALLLEHCPNCIVGFGGMITYPKADHIRDSLISLRDHISHSPQPCVHFVLETDAPYLSPQAVRWLVNTPAHILHTYEYIATMLSLPPERLQQYVHRSMQLLYDSCLL